MVWVRSIQQQFASFMEALGSEEPAAIDYRGSEELTRAEGWPAALERSLPTDRSRGATSVGPHRDDLVLQAGGRSLREFGSTGQQRTAAIALKLVELATLRRPGVEPALLLDDVFAELDGDRQRRLAALLLEGQQSQVFLTSPRADELPANLDLPVWVVEGGRVRGKE
jgi:DNA replication and repair protein RecF